MLHIRPVFGLDMRVSVSSSIGVNLRRLVGSKFHDRSALTLETGLAVDALTLLVYGGDGEVKGRCWITRPDCLRRACYC